MKPFLQDAPPADLLRTNLPHNVRTSLLFRNQYKKHSTWLSLQSAIPGMCDEHCDVLRRTYRISGWTKRAASLATKDSNEVRSDVDGDVARFVFPGEETVKRRVQRRRFDEADRTRVYGRTDGHCYLCKVHLPRKSPWHIEHVFAFSSNPGENDVVGNLLPSCATCNASKSDRCLLDFVNRTNADLSTLVAVHPSESLQPRVKRVLFHALVTKISREAAKAASTDIDELARENERATRALHDLPTLPWTTLFPANEDRACLGRGTEGGVYRATLRSAEVAVKVVAQSPAPEHLSLISTLEHPNLVRILGQTKGEFNHGLVLELMDGDLESDQGKDVFASAVPHHVLGLLGALKYMHGRRLMHRDVKPANMLFSRAARIVKLADYGILRPVGGRATRGVGSLGFRAPELRDGDTYTTAVDMFSFGMAMCSLSSSVLHREDKALLDIIVSKTNAPDPQSRADAASLFTIVDERCGDAEPVPPVPQAATATEGTVYKTEGGRVYHTLRLCYGASVQLSRTTARSQRLSACTACGSKGIVFVRAASTTSAYHAVEGCYNSWESKTRATARREGRKPCKRCL